MRHGGASTKCFSWSGVRPLIKKKAKMDRFQYKDKLEKLLLLFAEENMPLKVEILAGQ